jgi:secreted trypsin-like serine protease
LKGFLPLTFTKTKYFKKIMIDDNQVCAGTGDTDVCFGDSGGPLMVMDEAGHWNVIGITSFGLGVCAEPGVPTVYTRVDKYLDWINANTRA